MQNFKPFSTLIGHICDNVSTNDLMTPGKFWAETTPERHYNYLWNQVNAPKKEKYQFDYIDVYQNLTQDQALFLALSLMSFMRTHRSWAFLKRSCFFIKCCLIVRGNLLDKQRNWYQLNGDLRLLQLWTNL